MQTRLRLALSCAALALTACPAPEGEPPLFNAKDLSVQCPTGQVGWDFSTGGNDSAIVENSVSREITIDSATLGTCNYQGDFAVDCDGRRDCTRLVKKTTSPPCAGGPLNLTYHCGDETPRYTVVLSGEASAQTVTLACAEPLTILSAVYGSNAPTAANQANITAAVASACTGKRRCGLEDPYVLNNRQDVWPNNPKETLIRYYCGADPVLKETTVASGARVDIQCPLSEAKAATFRDTLRVQGVTCGSAATCSAPRQQAAQVWDKKVRDACEGKKSCRLRMDPFVSWRDTPGHDLMITYWCSSPQAPETRAFRTTASDEPYVDLYCGTPIRIVSATGTAANLVEARSLCDYKSRCRLPQIEMPTDGGFAFRGALYQYTCGDNAFDVRTRDLGDSPICNRGVCRLRPADEMKRQIECDRYTNNLVGGIRVVSATVGGADALLSTTNSCYGRDTCFYRLPGAFVNGSATYRCGNSYALKTATVRSTLPTGLEFSCRPDVKVVSLECDYDDPNYPENAKKCVKPLESYFMTTPAHQLCAAGNSGVCDIQKRKAQIAHLKWTCGEDPRVYSYDGLGEPDPWGPHRFEILQPRCETPETPYVAKACVPEFCAGNMRRDAKLACVPDATKTQTEVFTAPFVKTWLPGADGGTSQWGGADTTTLTEDFPFQVFSFTQYKAAGGVRLPPTTGVTVWAYDEFLAKPGATSVPASKRTTYGFRCVVSEAPIRDAEYSPTSPGFRRVINGGKGGVLPTTCYRQNVDDGRNAWFDAARRVGMPESQFRAAYDRRTSWLVSAFDAQGRFAAKRADNRLLNAVNPIGFFYDSANGWIDQFGFYAQSTDYRFKKEVTFVESSEIQLSAMSATLREAQVKLDVGKPALLPTFDVDLTWSQRGDSPSKNPLSPRSLLAPSAAVPLNQRNLRATIELGRKSATEDEWVTVNATSFPAAGLGSGNAMSQTQRLSAALTPALRERLLAVKGTDAANLQTADGFMRSFDEDQTLFRVRVCMDFDGVTHALGTANTTSASLDDRGVTAQRDGATYGLKFVKRCAESAPLLLQRELFIFPTTPYVTVEAPANSASSPRQGDSASGSTNDMGNQSGCTETGGRQTCSGQSRNGMTTGGQFSLSAFDTGSGDETTQDSTVKTTTLSSNMTVFGFKIFDLSGGGNAMPQSPGAWQVQIDLSPNLQAISDAWKSRRTGGVKTAADGKKMKPKAKKGLSALASKFERDGLALKLGKEFPFTLGPFPFVLEVSFTVGFGFGASVRLSGDYQSTTSMVNPKYPCLKSTPGECFIAYPESGQPQTPKTFEDALQDCRFKGGTLAEVRSASDLAEVTSAASMVGTANSALWLGGQAAYQYADPRCDVTRDARCAGTSRTRWSWLTGNVPFANQRRQEPALLDPASLVGNHGFGTNLGILTSYVPDKGAVLFKKDTSRLVSARITDTAAWVCMFDPANSYLEASMGVEVKAEFSMGFQAKICTPSTDIGFCLGVGLNLITAGVNVSADRSRILIFNNSRVKVSLLGESKVEGSWEVAFMSGNFSAELNFLFWSTSWEIASYGGLYTIGGDLFPAVISPYARTFP